MIEVVSTQTNLVIYNLSPRFSLHPELHNDKPTLVTVIGGEEEHFEDFGESNTSELLLESSMEGTEGQVDSPLVKPSEQVNGSSILSPRYELVFSRQTDMFYKLNYNLRSLKIV